MTGGHTSAPTAPGFLAGTRVVFARELAATFDSNIAYVAAIGFLLLASSLFMNEFFLVGRLDMTPFFELLPPLFVLFLPAISMRLWAEDRRTRTFELLVTLPLRPLQLVLGKYGAALGLFAVFLLGTTPIVVMLCALGDPDLLLIASGYLGAFLFGALLLAIGALLSSLSSDQIVAFILTALVSFALVVSGDERVVAVLDGLVPALAPGTWIAATLSALPHYEAFVRGVVELSALLYFVVFSAAILALGALVVQRHRT
ncbi:MAG: ABC transporter permease [Planctomycetota bacterium]|nr:MAG: ABC transporter permease [Planctomycetota bacterium]